MGIRQKDDARTRPTEIEQARKWAETACGSVADVPFSFVYDGRPSRESLPSWTYERSVRRIDDARTEHILSFADPATGLSIRCTGIHYDDFPVVEWTTWLRNDGSEDTPIISDLLGIDSAFPWSPDGEPDKASLTLHHNIGSPYTPQDYKPLVTPLGPNEEKRIATNGGRSSNSDLPYFNLEFGGATDPAGVIVVIGWPGQWAATFIRDAGSTAVVRAGQEMTHFRLKPGEEARTPRIVLLFWEGDRVRSQNIWRRWMIQHNMPRPHGKTPESEHFACSSHQFGEMIHADEASQITFVDRYLAEGITLDYWWMDAGWYPNERGWPHTGTWEVDAKRFPRGLRYITDHAHARGVDSIVWFEPERVTSKTWLYDNHPEWLISYPGREGEQKLLDLGNPAAREWLVNHVDKTINEQGIDLYRQDFNMDPLDYWRANDAPDRQGMTEMAHVMGLLWWWDELKRRHPDMLFDTCASGGRAERRRDPSPVGAAHPQRLDLRAGQPAVPHLRHRVVDSLLRHRADPGRRLQLPEHPLHGDKHLLGRPPVRSALRPTPPHGRGVEVDHAVSHRRLLPALGVPLR